MRRGLLPLSSTILVALSGAAGTGLVARDAAAQVAKREDEDTPVPLLIVRSNKESPIVLAGHGSHRSHRSHSSHRSHYSSSGGGGGGRGGGGGGGGGGGAYVPAPTPAPVVIVEPKPKPPKPARVAFAAFPGGKIYVDGKLVGADTSTTLLLKPGSYQIKVVNRFLGDHIETITLSDGQTGTVTIKW